MNIHVVLSEQEAGMTISEFQERQQLNKDLMQDHAFVVVHNDDQRWKRFNELNIKYQAYLRKTQSLITT